MSHIHRLIRDRLIGVAAYYAGKLFIVTEKDNLSDYKFDITYETLGPKLLEYKGMGAWYMLRSRRFYNGPIPAKFSDLIDDKNYESNLDFEKKIWISPSHYVLKNGNIPVEHIVINRIKKNLK